jgi:hypothetical protein
MATAAGSAGIIIAIIVITWYINDTIYESEKRFQTTLLRHYVDEHLNPR